MIPIQNQFLSFRSIVREYMDNTKSEYEALREASKKKRNNKKGLSSDMLMKSNSLIISYSVMRCIHTLIDAEIKRLEKENE